MKEDTVEYVEYVVSLGLSVSKEEIDKAGERLSETEGGKGLGLARVDLERWSLFRENCLGEFCFEMEFCRDRIWRVGTSKKSSEGFLVGRLMGGSSLVRAIIVLVEKNSISSGTWTRQNEDFFVVNLASEEEGFGVIFVDGSNTTQSL